MTKYLSVIIVVGWLFVQSAFCGRFKNRKISKVASIIQGLPLKRMSSESDSKSKTKSSSKSESEEPKRPKTNALTKQISSLKSILKSIKQWEKHSYEELSWFLEYFNKSCTPYTYLYSIGSSVQNREIWVMAISDNPSIHEIAEPEVKIVGNIHGNEAVGREIILHMIDHICSNIETDSELKNIIENTRIHFLPSLNPDGFEMSRAHPHSGRMIGRLNANGVDLNRNFPDQFFPSFRDPEPETLAVIKWMDDIPFVISASLHDGAFVVIYPYDDSPSGQTKYSATPDDDIFRYLARLYAETHPEMHLSNMGNCSRYSQHKKFIGGITNGAEWSSLSNTMQDYNYVRTNCFEITIEMSCTTYLNDSNIQTLFNQNYPSLLAFIRQASRGIKGVVLDVYNNTLEGVHISIADRKHDVKTAKDGDFWRLVLPGTYEVSARLKGYETAAKVITVENSVATWVNFTLSRAIIDPSIAELGHVGSLQKSINTLVYESDGRDLTDLEGKEEYSSDNANIKDEEDNDENGDRDYHEDKKGMETTSDVIDQKYLLPSKGEPYIADKRVKSTDDNSPKQQKLKNKNIQINDLLSCSIPGRTQNIVGMLRWNGIIPDLLNHTTSHIQSRILGLELLKSDPMGTDGTFLGKRYFNTKQNYAYFVPMNLCEKMKTK